MRLYRELPVQVVRGTCVDDDTWTDLDIPDDLIPVRVDSRAFVATIDAAAFVTATGETSGDYAVGLHFSAVGMRASDGTVTIDETEQTMVGNAPVFVVLKVRALAITDGFKIQIKADTVADGALAVTAAADVRTRES